MTDRIQVLKSLGAVSVVPFYRLLVEYRDLLLPNLFWEQPEYYKQHSNEIRLGKALLDAKGQEEFDRQMRLRLGDFSGQVIDSETQYFPKDIVRIDQNEVFVDCGAYDGDTIEDFRTFTNDHFERIVAFEPDPDNFEALRSAVRGESRIAVKPYAIGGRRETLRFAIGGTGARISSTGTCEVQAISLDEALEGIAATYIKLDIEGSEPDAL
jgi:FkbM family methyltransferase